MISGLSKGLEEQGYVVMKGFLEPSVVASVRAAAASIVDGIAGDLVKAGKVPHDFRGEPFETRLIRLFEHRLDEAPKQFRENLHLPGTFPLFFHPALLDLVEGVLGLEVRLYPNYTIRPKLPEWKGTEVLWHQDGAYTQNAGAGGTVATMHMVNVWTPLVPASVENGCMEFIPGTHRLGVVRHVDRGHYLEIVEEELDPRRSEAIPIELHPGDIVLFHNLLFHRGLPNHARTIRWSADWRYQDAREPTLRPDKGHLARSASHPERAVRSAEEWARLSFI